MTSKFRAALTGLCLVAGSALTAQAAVSSWVMSEGGKMRMAALPNGTGKVTAIIEIEPAPGWKTYWRAPGDAGLPPQIDLSQDRNLKLIKVSYPAPEIGHDEGGRFLGYRKPVSLVLELERPNPAEASELNANVLVGLCKDICLPFQTTFRLPLEGDGQPQADEFMKIQMAKAELPEAPSPAFGVAEAGLTPDKAYLEAVVTTPGGQTPEIAVAPSPGLLLGAKPEMIRKDGRTLIRYPVMRLPQSLKGATVTLLVKAAGRATESTLALD